MGERWGRLVAAGLAALLAAAPLAPAALADPAAAAEADRAALVQGLQAQFEISLIRERKLADDRETQLISTLEARLRAARAQADAARGDARKAIADLAAARTEYAQTADTLSQRDPAAANDVAAYHAQAQSLVLQASPQMLAALQRFADGDRTGAWPTLVSLTDAAAAAPGAIAGQRAAGLRQLASLRDIMRAHGEATTADVLALYDRAAEADPANFTTQLQRARLAHDLGDLSRAKAAALQAASVTSDEAQRAMAIRMVGEQSEDQRDTAGAAKAFDQALVILRRIAAADATPVMQNEVALTLLDKGDVQVVTGDFDGARASYSEALTIRQALAAAQPANALLQGYLAYALMELGDLDLKVGDQAGARTHWVAAMAIRQQLTDADPSNVDKQFFLSVLMRRIGELDFKRGDVGSAKTLFEQCLAIRQRLAAANRSDADIQLALAFDYENLAGVAFDQNDIAAARTDYAESLAIRRRLGAADPTNAVYQQLILRSMARQARIPGAAASWTDVAGQYRAIRAAGHLIPEDDVVLQALRAHGLAAGL